MLPLGCVCVCVCVCACVCVCVILWLYICVFVFISYSFIEYVTVNKSVSMWPLFFCVEVMVAFCCHHKSGTIETKAVHSTDCWPNLSDPHYTCCRRDFVLDAAGSR